MRGAGRAVFAATLLLIVGTLNIICGIGALDDANVLVNDHRLVLTNLNTLGWVSSVPALGAIAALLNAACWSAMRFNASATSGRVGLPGVSCSTDSSRRAARQRPRRNAQTKAEDA